jgi:hypothetical protein
MKYEDFDEDAVFVNGAGQHVTHPWGKGGQKLSPKKHPKKNARRKK